MGAATSTCTMMPPSLIRIFSLLGDAAEESAGAGGSTDASN